MTDAEKTTKLLRAREPATSTAPEGSRWNGGPSRLLDGAEDLAHRIRGARDRDELGVALSYLTAALESLANTSLELSLATRSLEDAGGADGPPSRPGEAGHESELVMRLLFAVSQNLRLARQISQQAGDALALSSSAA